MITTCCANQVETGPYFVPGLPHVAAHRLDLFKTHGMATEDTIIALHYPDVFLVELQGGTSSADFQSYGLYVGSSSETVTLPATFVDNATVLTYQGDSSSCLNMSIPASAHLTAITFFVANNATLSLSGTFWTTQVTQTITAADGAKTTTTAPKGGVGLPMKIGEYVRFATGKAAV